MNWMLIHFVCGTRSIQNLSISALMTTMSCALDILQIKGFYGKQCLLSKGHAV